MKFKIGSLLLVPSGAKGSKLALLKGFRKDARWAEPPQRVVQLIWFDEENRDRIILEDSPTWQGTRLAYEE